MITFKKPYNPIFARFQIFYTAKLTNSLFRLSIFSYLLHGQKVFKTLDFWFIDTWNNIHQFQRSGSCIRISDVGILVGRIQPQILLEAPPHTHTLGRIQPQILLEGHKSFSLSIHTHVCMCTYAFISFPSYRSFFPHRVFFSL